MRKIVIISCLYFFIHFTIAGQSAKISEEIQSVDTYFYSEPNPVPILADNAKIYPYYRFEGYEHKPTKKDWKVVTLENDYIKLWILPEMGGKVWGAIEKSTGEEFLYKNEVMKFRNLAMRGPWTSGGLEFNFGIIGHSPDTATPVDYKLSESEDGSVSCVVGTMDVAARNRWWVKITLEKDKAYFETQASWYNGTPLNQSYYNWMTAAATVADDLEFIYPGNQYLEHSGEAKPWPYNEDGRNLAIYRNNNFGPAKSKHIVGEYNDIFGGYYHNKKFGFGHWGLYEEIPGQKLWLWALSRFGGIWEQLLTDTDGQYMEYQAGRLFNQYFPRAVNPISQANFDPHVMDRWRELWFPFKKIGGMVAATEHGVLNVNTKDEKVLVGINALQPLNENLVILKNGKEVYRERLSLKPMGVHTVLKKASVVDTIEVLVENTQLYFKNDPERLKIKRPFKSEETMRISEIEQLHYGAWEDMKFRNYHLAHEKLSQLVKIDSFHRNGLVKLSELEYRRTNYEKALKHANRVLRQDTYDAGANYITGISYRALGDHINALESLGWAARDVKFRSVGHAQMAEIYLQMKDYHKAKIYANKALEYNVFNLNARKVLAIIHRKMGNDGAFKKQIAHIQDIDPLNHFIVTEQAFWANEGSLKASVLKNIHNEFLKETILELALMYHHLNLSEEAQHILEIVPNDSKINLWAAYYYRNQDKVKSDSLLKKVVDESIEFVFPYRQETARVLEWANNEIDHWKLKYLLAQNYFAVNLRQESEALLKQVQDKPTTDTFYRFRAKMLESEGYNYQLDNYTTALDLDGDDWKVWEEFVQFYLENKKYDQALKLTRKATRKFPNNYNIGLVHSKALLHTGNYAEVLAVLKDIQILPYEHARESRQVYEKAHIAIAQENYSANDYIEALKVLKMSKEWPENIGVGKPYDADERPQDYLLALTYAALHNTKEKDKALNSVIAQTIANIDLPDTNHVFGLWALEKQRRTEDLERMLLMLENNVSEHPENQLALALYKKDTSELMRLKGEDIVDKTLWKLYSVFNTL